MKKSLTKQVLSFLAYVLFFVVVYTTLNHWRAPTPPPAIDLSYTNTQGNTADVIALSHERPVLVYFWGSWCGVCRLTSPNVQTLHAEQYPVISVAVSSGDDGELLAYMNRHQYQFATLNDQDGTLFHAWQAQATPSFVIIRDGKAHQRFMGITPLWLLKMRLWLAT